MARAMIGAGFEIGVLLLDREATTSTVVAFVTSCSRRHRTPARRRTATFSG